MCQIKYLSSRVEAPAQYELTVERRQIRKQCQFEMSVLVENWRFRLKRIARTKSIKHSLVTQMGISVAPETVRTFRSEWESH